MQIYMWFSHAQFARLVPFSYMYVLLAARPNIMTVFFFFTNWMHKFFILIHLLYSPTCFEHRCAHLQGGQLYQFSIWYRHCLQVPVQYTGYGRTGTCFVGQDGRIMFIHFCLDGTLVVTCALNSHVKTVMIPPAVLIQFFLLKMSTIVLETCTGM